VQAVNALQLARHFENAGMIEKAIGYLHQAGDRAIQISGNAEGISHLSKALVMLENQPPSLKRDEKELAIQLSIAMSWKYNWEAMAESMTIDRIRELSIKLNKRSPLARMLNEESIRHYVQADYQQAFSCAHECLQLAEQEQDPLLLAEAHWLLGVINFSTANFMPALEHLDKVNSFYNPRDHHDQLIHIRGVDAGLSAASYRACCLWCLGYPDQALELSLETLAFARQFGHAFTLADVLSFAGCLLFALVGDAQSLAATAEDLAALSESANLSLAGWVSMSKYYLGEALTLQGKFEQAIPLIEDSLETSQSTEVKLYRSMAFRFLATALLDAGETNAALENVQQALLFVEKTGENLWKADLLRIRARAMRSMDEKQAAYSDLEDALALTRTQQAKSWELRVTIDLARFWADKGQFDRAHELLRDCYAWFTEGFETPDLKEAEALLAKLSKEIDG
jgi:tetratricopeptide (TPR) repeat protein